MNELLTARYSPRDFDTTHEISPAEITTLLQAARLAPSSFNEQPWKFYYAERQNVSGHEKLYSTILEGNKPWSGEASLLVLGVANTQFSRNGKTNRHAFYDLGQSVANLIVQTTDIGLYAHQMGGFSVDKAKENLELSEGLEPVVMIAIGKRLGTETPERNRKDVQDISQQVI